MGIVRPVMEKFPYAWAFFVPFILVTSFAIINLFIGVIVDAMHGQHDDVIEEVHADAQAIEGKIEDVEKELSELRRMFRARGGA